MRRIPPVTPIDWRGRILRTLAVRGTQSATKFRTAKPAVRQLIDEGLVARTAPISRMCDYMQPRCMLTLTTAGEKLMARLINKHRPQRTPACMMFVVFDLDGTLANTDHRSHHVRGDRKNWRGFFADCEGDAPHMHIIAIFQAMKAAGHRVEIWSGRSDEVRDKTEAWLVQHQLQPDSLRMRPANDYTPDDMLKRQWLSDHGRPDMIFDDRNKVVAMWRQEGIPCLQVAPGDF